MPDGGSYSDAPASDLTSRERALARLQQMQRERQPWFDHCRDIAQVLQPRLGRFFPNTNQQRQEIRFTNIYDNSATTAWRTLGAGLMAGMTSPARPWFRLKTPDADLNKQGSVRTWLSAVQKQMLDIFNLSNTYWSLHKQYESHGFAGTAAALVFDDFENVIQHQALAVGEYFFGVDKNGDVDTLYRRFEMNALQLVDEYGYQNCSITVRNQFDRRQFDTYTTVIHAIEPRAAKLREGKIGPKGMAFQSLHFEEACSGYDTQKYLRESGFKYFPAMASRWWLESGDIYGFSPAMECFGDIKQLQHQQFRKGQAIDFMVKPALQIPIALASVGVDSSPGGENYLDPTVIQMGGIKELWKPTLQLNELKEDILDVRRRIDTTFYKDLFLMLAMSDQNPNGGKQPITAREVAERHEEKLLMLGPVLERLHNEMLAPLIEMTFARMVEANILPPPPQELHMQQLSVQFISVLAQAQQAVGLGAFDRLLGTVAAIAPFKQDVLDKIDSDELVDRYADQLGVDPEVIVSSEKVALIRQERAQQQQAAQAQAAMAQGADTAKNLSQADTSGKNGLTDVMSRLTGYTGGA